MPEETGPEKSPENEAKEDSDNRRITSPDIPGNYTLPDVYPPKPPIPPPAMQANFKFHIGEYVEILTTPLKGSVVGAAVVFNQGTHVYLVETGTTDSRERWYPENLIVGARLYMTGVEPEKKDPEKSSEIG